MPGPISDSLDPEFGTASNAADVSDAIQQVRGTLTAVLGEPLRNIVEVAQGMPGASYRVTLSEREIRLLRFCVDRALESI